MVNGSFSVNILHCSFGNWLRSWREETIAQCWSEWHSTPLDQWVYVWIGWQRQKTSSEFKVAMLHYMSCVLIFTEWNLVPRTSLPNVIAMQFRQLCAKTNVKESSSTYSPSKGDEYLWPLQCTSYYRDAHNLGVSSLIWEYNLSSHYVVVGTCKQLWLSFNQQRLAWISDDHKMTHIMP